MIMFATAGKGRERHQELIYQKRGHHNSRAVRTKVKAEKNLRLYDEPAVCDLFSATGEHAAIGNFRFCNILVTSRVYDAPSSFAEAFIEIISNNRDGRASSYVYCP
jgi:hypothetical protein